MTRDAATSSSTEMEKQIVQLYANVFVKYGQSATDGSIVGALYVLNKGQGATQAELASLLDINQSTISRSLSLLTQVGRAEKTRIPKSREFLYKNVGSILDVSMLSLVRINEMTIEIQNKLSEMIKNHGNKNWSTEWAKKSLKQYKAVSKILMEAIGKIEGISGKE